MFEYTQLHIVIEPDGRGDFTITASDKPPEPNPYCQYLKTIIRDNSLYPMKVYGINVHLGDVDFEALDLNYWRFYQILKNRTQWA